MLTGSFPPLTSNALEQERRLTAACRNTHLKCFGSITEFLVSLKTHAKVVRRLGVTLLRCTLKHLKSDVGRSVGWIKQVRNVILRIGVTQISRFTNIPARGSFIALEAIAVQQVVANIVIAASDTRRDQLLGKLDTLLLGVR